MKSLGDLGELEEDLTKGVLWDEKKLMGVEDDERKEEGEEGRRNFEGGE